MKEHKSQHSDNAKDVKTLIINALNSNLKTPARAKSIEKNNFISIKEKITKVFDIKIKNCLEKINILNTISRSASVKSPIRKIIFNNEHNEILQKTIQNNIKVGEIAGKLNIHEKNIIQNRNISVMNKKIKEEENINNNITYKDNNILSKNNLYLYSLESSLDFQRQIINQLKNKDYNRNKLISDLHILIELCPIVKDFKVKQPLFVENDFEIFDDKKKDKFLFMLNLTNIISFLNFVWEVAEYDSKNFNRYITNLGIYISFVKRNENTNNIGIDFVLLAPLSANLYNFISCYGKTGFKNEKYNDLAVEFSSFLEKYGYDDGYCYEELNISNLIQNIEENSYTINPKVMYYIKPNTIKKIINKRIINEPENYEFAKQTSYKKYEGFNEIDFSLTMQKDSQLTENENFKVILEETKMEESGNIILNKGSTYLFEIKKSIDKIYECMSDTNKKNKRFLEAYKNVEITQNIKLNYENYSFIYLCNKDYNKVMNFIKNKNMEKNNIIYSNPQIGISILIKLRNTMKYLNAKIDYQNEQMVKQKEEIEKKLDKQKNEFEKRLEKEKKERENEIKMMNDKFLMIEKERIQEKYENLMLALDVIWPTSIDYLIKSIKFNGFSQEKIKSYNKLYEIFYKFSKEFLKIKTNLLYSRIIPFIGNTISKDEDIKEWINIKDILLKRSEEMKPYSDYYKAIAEFLYGISYLKSGKNLDCDIMSNSKSKEKKVIKEIILYLEILYEENDISNIEMKYQEIVLYLSKDLLDEHIINQIIKKENNSKQMISKLITCANQENYILYNQEI